MESIHGNRTFETMRTLNKIQKQERAKRKQNRLNAMGLQQPPGTKPCEYKPPAEPVWKPMPKTAFDFGELMARFNRLFGGRK